MSPVIGKPTLLSWRLWVVAAILGGGLGLVGLKSARLQLGLGDDLKELAERQYLRTLKFSAPRGNVYDRDGRPLAVSVPVWSVSASPRTIDDKDLFAARLAPVLVMSESKMRSKLEKPRAFAWLRRRIAPEVAKQVRELDLDGLGLHEESRRFYPNRTLAGQLLGTVSIDGDGQSGVERAFDEHLRGRSLVLPGLRDNRGRRIILAQGVDLEVLEGDDVYLTIDAHLQSVAEESLARAVEEHRAKSGTAVVIEPSTGAVLAVATAPLFNPNAPGSSPKGSRRNRALADVFEPGSTFKTITFAAALDAGAVSPEEQLFCENGRFKLGRYTIRDTHPLGWLSARDVFKHSSNICTLKIAHRLGEERFREAVGRFGFGEAPGLGLVEASRGRLPREKRWGDVRLGTISYGHGIGVSAVQLASAIGTVANRGIRVKPSLLQRVESPAGVAVRTNDDDTEVRVISEEAATITAEIMTSVFEKGGTGSAARIPGVMAAGKTGTAEKVDPVTGRYSRDLNTASFVGFAPLDNPRVVAAVVLDEPQTSHFGGATAGPVWKEIVTAALIKDGILTAAALEGSKAPKNVAPKAKKKGAPKLSRADLSDEEKAYLNLSAREAVQKASEAGLLVDLTGVGRVHDVDIAQAIDEEPGRIRLVLTPEPTEAVAP